MLLPLRDAADAVAEYGQRVRTLHGVAAGCVDALLRGLSDAEIRLREAELRPGPAQGLAPAGRG